MTLKYPTPPPDLSDKIVKLSDIYCDGGGYGDVWKCLYTCSSGSQEVAVKALRFRCGMTTDQGSDSKDNKYVRLARRELGIWRRLDHKNIVPFLGIAYGFGPHLALVSLWMPHGTLRTFLAAHDDKLETLHRLQLLLDVADGLLYLHSHPFVHGDLTSNNILIDETCCARLVDFGLASLVGEIPEGLAYLHTSGHRVGVARWAAPEHFTQDEGIPFQRTTKSDIYSFGHVALQVLSGKEPWSEVREDIRIAICLSQGQNPGRPMCRKIEDSHWEFIQQCWLSPNKRPTACEIVPILQSFLELQPPAMPFCDLLGLSPTEVPAPPSTQIESLQDSLTQGTLQDIDRDGFDYPSEGGSLDTECLEQDTMSSLRSSVNLTLSLSGKDSHRFSIITTSTSTAEDQRRCSDYPVMPGIVGTARSLLRMLGSTMRPRPSSPEPPIASIGGMYPIPYWFHEITPWHQFAIVLHHPSQTSGIVALTKKLVFPSVSDTSTSKRTSVAALRLFNPPSGGSTDSLIQAYRKEIGIREFLTTTFEPLGEYNDVITSASLFATSRSNWGTAVVTHAIRYLSQLIVIPWIPPSICPTSSGWSQSRDARARPEPFQPFVSLSPEDTFALSSHFVHRVFEQSKADVAFFVDLGGNTSTSGQHILFPFFGGRDDRLALKFVVQLCTNPDVSATVIRVQQTSPAEGLTLDENVDPRYEPALPSFTELLRTLRSEIADHSRWFHYATPALEKKTNQRHHQLHVALSRIEFTEFSSSSPLHALTRRSKELCKTHSGKRLFVVAGRSRRPTGLDDHQELEQIAVEQGFAAYDSVQKIIGDVAASFLIAGTQDGIVVLRRAG